MPMSEVRTSLWSASSRSAAMASTSERAGGSASGSSRRIDSGTAASVNASSESYPSASSITACSAASGPMWRSSNRSRIPVVPPGAAVSPGRAVDSAILDPSARWWTDRRGGRSPSVVGPERFTRADPDFPRR